MANNTTPMAIKFLVFTLLIVSLTGCVFVPGTPFDGAAGVTPNPPSVNPIAPVLAPPGFLFELTIVPLAVNPTEQTVDPATLKKGSAEARQIVLPILSPLLSFGWDGDPLKMAMEDGQISTLHHADIRHFNVLGIYSTQRVIAYGIE